MSNTPRERGRPPLPKDEKKTKINITLDKDLLAWVDQHGTNRSRFINRVLRAARPAADAGKE